MPVIKNNLHKRIHALIMAVSFLMVALPVCAFGAPYTKNGNILQSVSGKQYYLNDVGGVKAYIPLQYAKQVHDKASIQAAMTTGIGVTSNEGSMAETAAFRYQGFGSRYANLVKIAANDGLTKSGRWLVPAFDIGEEHNVMFRYAGIGITGGASLMDGEVTAEIISNPNFPSDQIQASGTSGGYSPTLYKKSSDGTNTMQEYTPSYQVYGRAESIYEFEAMFTNGMDGTEYFPGQGYERHPMPAGLRDARCSFYSTQAIISL